MARNEHKNELSRLIAPRDIGERPVTRKIEATPQEREALARRFDLIALDSLSAEVTLSWRRGEVVVEGRLDADAVQRCVVSLAPVPERVASEFTLIFREQAEGEAQREEEIDPAGEEELPEPFGPEGIDLGEAVAQQFALALAPYPRHPDATLSVTRVGPPMEEGEAQKPNPFAVLKNLKRE